MSEQVRYVTNEQGERVGVLLDLEAYNRLANPLALDEECLIGLSRDELQALADSRLAPAAQHQLDDLLVRNAESQLSADEIANLDHLLAQVDQLTILKTRARYTLHRLETLATVA
jgi:PHD/YefM family antitoxin component YafN of YafNO toxin-antitoxin module